MFEFNLGVQGIIRLQVFREGNLISDTSHKNDSTEALTRLSDAYGNPALSGSSAASAIGKIKVGYPGGQYSTAGNEVVPVSNAGNGVSIASTAGSGTVTTTCGGFDDIACPQNGYLDISLLDTTDAVISHRLSTSTPNEGVQVTATSGIAKGDTVIITYTLTITGLYDQAAHTEAATFFKDPSTINGAGAMKFNAMGIYTNSGQTTKLAFPDSTNTGSGQTDSDGFSDADQGPVLGTAANPKPIKMQRSISALTQTPYGAWIDNTQGTVIKTASGAMGWDPANSGRRHTFLFVTRFTGA